jgi:sugar fermentation stimulation protein A
VPKSPFHLPDVWKSPLFSNISKGKFINRPNRFVIRCNTEEGTVEAYLPNPGKLWELLLPGRIVYLVKKSAGAVGGLQHMAVAVEREEVPVLLHTHMANAVAAQLIAEKKIPGLEDAKIVRAEVTVGHSRFDFLLEKDKRPFFLEVKSCTLFGRSIAMFPDAITLRGKRHLTELAAMCRQGTAGGVLFLVHWPHADYFLPDYHTDLQFASAFKEVKNDLFIKAISLQWRPDLTLSPNVREMCIPWDTIAQEAKDSGSYIIMLHIAGDVEVTVGSLGAIHFAPGYYLYVGTAKRALTKRLNRHLRKNKTSHWHLDYLRNYADGCVAIPIRSSEPLEQQLAAALQGIADGSIPAFGSSDCGCASHLFHFAEHPLRSPLFIHILQHFRMDRLENIVGAPGEICNPLKRGLLGDIRR